MASVWKDPANVDIAKRMHYAGYTASQIAIAINRRLGCTSAHITRNAVIGIIHRQKWPRADAATGRRSKAATAQRKRKQRSKRTADLPVPLPRRITEPDLKPAPPPRVEPEVVVPHHRRKGLADLAPDDCRWPIGDPQDKDFHFCDKTRVEGMPYCEFHVRRAYKPPEPRKHMRSVIAPKKIEEDA